MDFNQIYCGNHIAVYTYIKSLYRVGKSRFTVVSTQNTGYSCIIINYCIIFHRNDCKPPFAHHCIVHLNLIQCYMSIISQQKAVGMNLHTDTHRKMPREDGGRDQTEAAPGQGQLRIAGYQPKLGRSNKGSYSVQKEHGPTTLISDFQSPEP